MLFTYIYGCQNVISIKSLDIESKQCNLHNFALHMSLPTIWNILSSSHKVPDIFERFSRIWIFSTDFRRGSQYKISRNPAQWDKGNDGQTDMTQPIGVIRDLRERDWKQVYGVRYSSVRIYCKGQWVNAGYGSNRSLLWEFLLWVKGTLLAKCSACECEYEYECIVKPWRWIKKK